VRGRVQRGQGLDGAALDVGQRRERPGFLFRDLLLLLLPLLDPGLDLLSSGLSFPFPFPDVLLLLLLLPPQQQRRPRLHRERPGLLALDGVELDAARERDARVGEGVQQRPAEPGADVDEVRVRAEARVFREGGEDPGGARAGDGTIKPFDALSAAEAGLLLEGERESFWFFFLREGGGGEGRGRG
jgi:hypothetical protein